MSNQPSEAVAGQQPDFKTVVQTFFLQAMMNVGKMPNPVNDALETNRVLANFNIRLLEILTEKTEGNLNDKEQEFLTECLQKAKTSYAEIPQEE